MIQLKIPTLHLGANQVVRDMWKKNAAEKEYFEGAHAIVEVSLEKKKTASLSMKSWLFNTVDGRNPAPPEIYITLKIMGKTTNLNWLAGFLNHQQ